jgi:hypothetical protein
MNFTLNKLTINLLDIILQKNFYMKKIFSTLFFSKWVAKTYNKPIQQAEELLKDF